MSDRAPMSAVAVGLGELVRYFAHLGTFGFGGPIALAGYMQRDLVERRRWFTAEEYKDGLALAQLAPGPLAAQLAIYLGWARFRIPGATLVAAAFVLPSFLMVMAISALYVRFGGLAWMQGLFYGIGAAVIAVIGRSAVKLVRMTVTRDRVLWLLLAVNAVVTAWTEREIVWVFLLSGLVVVALRAWPRGGGAALAMVPWPWMSPLLLGGVHGAASLTTLGTLFVYFTAAGAFVFGSGLAIVPFLHGGVVDRFHWLTDQQFLDAVAVAMITPGPVVITVAFIGYLVAGPAGATVAAVATFLPCYLFVIIPAPHFQRWSANRSIRAFIDGVTAAATGAIVGAVVVLARRSIHDVPTAAIALVTLVAAMRLKKVPEPLIIATAGVAGLLLQGGGA
jgi:chromate transporter